MNTILGTLTNEPQQLDLSIPKPTSRNSENSFDKFLQSMEESQARETERDNTRQPEKNTKPVDKKSKTEQSKPKQAEAPIKRASQDEPAYEAAAYEAVQVVQDNQPLSEETVQMVEEATDEIVLQVAEILQVPPETIMEWLAILNITPLQLTEPQAVVELLELALGAETTAELLVEPTFPALFEEINIMLDKVLAELPPEAQKTVYVPILPDVQVAVNDTTGEVVITNTVLDSTTPQQEIMPELIVVEEETEEVPQREARTQTQTTQVVEAIQQETEETVEPLLNLGDETNQENALFARQEDAFVPVVQINTVNTGTQTAAQVSQAQQPGPVNTADVMNQIMARVRTFAAENFAEIRLTLKPENLGDVTLKVMTQNGVVTAMFVAESQRVKEAIEANFNQLRDALAEQGVNVADLTVTVGREDDAQERLNQFMRARQNSRERMRRVLESNAAGAAGEAEQENANDGVLSMLDVKA